MLSVEATALPNSSNINYPVDVTKGQAGVDCAQMFLVEHTKISLRRPIATNLARIRRFNLYLPNAGHQLGETGVSPPSF